MYKEESLFWRRASLFISALFLSQVFLPSAFASSNGSVTSADPACTVCHTEGATTVMILGPGQVQALGKNTYTLTISGDGPAVQGGLDVYAPDGGVLSVVDAGTQLVNGEITHISPKSFSSGTVSWTFDWTAPAAVGMYDLVGQGVNGSGGNGNNGDFAGITTFTVDVVPVPIPAAGFLFGSALGLLAWLRRRIN
jgi:hypothetical protein